MVRMFALAPMVAGLLLIFGGERKASAQRPVLLDFSIEGCMPCRQLEPTIARLEREGFDVRRIDGHRQPQVAARFGVDRYPTLIVMADRQIVAKWQGPQSYETLRSTLQSATRPQRTAAAPATFASQSSAGRSNTVPEVTIPGEEQRPAAPAQSPPADLAARLLQSTVRLRVRDAGGSSFGTGTIIDARQGEALVLTCAHLFREGGQAPALTAELFESTPAGPRVAERVAGQVLSYDLKNDVALVAIRPSTAPPAAPIARTAESVAIQQAVWSVGCDRGADPTVRGGRVLTTEKYQTPVSLTVSGAPVVGRSGGGLFNARGELVGVCYGSDAKTDEGFYAKLSSVYGELDKMNLQAIYRGPTTQPTTGLATAATGSVHPGITAMSSATAPAPGLTRAQPQRGPDLVRGQDAAAATPGEAASRLLSGLPAAEQAALQEIARRAAESEVVCVIRPKTPGGKSEVITLDRVSPELLRALLALRPTPAGGQRR